MTTLTAPPIVEGAKAFYLPAPSTLVDLERATAMAGARARAVNRPDMAWLDARLVEAGPPGRERPNRNGHIFGLDDLRRLHPTVVGTPLNMGHKAHYIVGHNVATELDEVSFELPVSHVLSAFYRGVWPVEYRAVQAAHDLGAGFVSMEAIPESMTCRTAGCCDETTYPWRGIQHDSYCASMNTPRTPKRLNNPRFVGVGVIIPPQRPGWAGAHITSFGDYEALAAAVVDAHTAEADLVYEAIRADSPHLEARQWEQLMEAFLVAAFPDDPRATATRAPARASAAGASARDPHRYEAGAGGCAVCAGVEPAAGVCAGTGAVAKDYSAEERREMARKHQALADGSYPIRTVEDLRNAIQAYGRAPESKRAEVRAHIIRRARALGESRLLPDDWARDSLVEPAVAANGQGAMICLYPDDPEAIHARVASDPNADPPGELHVTVAFVAEDADSLAEPARAAIGAAALAAAKVRSEPLELTVVGYGSFGGATPPATVLFVQQTGPDAARDGACAVMSAARGELDDYGADAFPPAHDANVPHLTVGYGVDLALAAQFVGETIRFSQGVTVTMAGQRTTIPWGADH